MIRSPLFSFLALTVIAASACSKSDAASGDTSAPVTEAQPPSNKIVNTVPVAERPANPCGWISVDEVTAIVGPLAGPPTPHEGACRYPLPIPQSVLDDRALQLKALERISKMPGASPMEKKEYEPYAIDLTVNVNGEIAAERTGDATFRVAKNLAGDSSVTVDERLNKNGWDVQKIHGGRIGQLNVDVSLSSFEVALPRDKLDTLAARTRDHVRDLPFAVTPDYSAPDEPRDPCVLLTRQEVEAVIGPLVVPPYRSANVGPLAYPKGTSCSYFTRGHHVLVVTPHWDNGKFQMRTLTGIQGLMGKVMDNASDQSADTLDGPWDQAAVDLDGRLALLKGDRLLEIQYLMSTTDEAGALKLARPALERLTNAH